MPSTASPLDSRRAQEQELRRADVLQAATEVFAERGFDGARVGEIARRASVSNSTIYGLWGSKEALYQAVALEIGTRIRERVEEAVHAIEDPVDQLLATVDALCAVFESDRRQLHLFLRDMDAMPWKVRQTLGDDGLVVYRGFADRVTELAQRAMDDGRLRVMSPATFAHVLLGAVATTLTRSVQDDPDRSLEGLGSELRAGVARLLEVAP